MKINLRNIDILWNYLGLFFSLAANVIWLPLLIYFLSADRVGIWYIFVSIGTIVSLIDFGFSSQVSRAVAYSWSGALNLQSIGIFDMNVGDDPNYELLNVVIKMCRMLYLVLGIIVLLLMSTAGTFYVFNITNALSDNTIFFAWGIYILSVFFNIYIGYYTVVLRGIGDLSHLSKANIISKFFMISIGIVLLNLGYGIIGLSISGLLSGFLQRYICKMYLKKYHHLWEMFSKVVRKNNYTYEYVMKALWHNTWRDGLVTIANYFNTQATILICGMFLTLSETGIYSLSIQIIGAIIGIASGVNNSYMPSLYSAWVNKDRTMAKVIIAKSITTYYIIAILGILCFMLLGIDIIKWIKPEFVINNVVFLLMAFHMFLLSRHQMAASYISTMNKLPYTLSFVVSSFASVVVAFLLMKYENWGIYGLIIGPMAIQSIYNNWKWNHYINQQLDVNEYTLIKIGFDKYMKHFRKA